MGPAETALDMTDESFQRESTVAFWNSISILQGVIPAMVVADGETMVETPRDGAGDLTGQEVVA